MAPRSRAALVLTGILMVPVLVVLAPAAEAGAAHVEVSGSAIKVNGKSMGILKCVSYQPVPPGVSAAHGYRWAHHKGNYERDLGLLDRLGANVVQVNTRAAAEPWELREFMDRALSRGMRTILVVNGPNYEDPRSERAQRAFLGDVARAVDEYGDHPGLLMWQLGIEVDWSHRGSDRVDDWYLSLIHISEPTRPY